MKVEICYNDNLDEFTGDLNLEMRLQKYIKNHFYPAYIISTLSPVYLIGGAIRDLIYAKNPKDLDFVILGEAHLDWVLEVFNTFNIQYNFNRFGGYKFIYENTEIDLWFTENLFSSIQYNVDGLFFNLNTNQLVSLTFEDFQKNGLKLMNKENNIENNREEKLMKFEKQFLNNKSSLF